MYTIPSRRAYIEITIMFYGMPLLSLFDMSIGFEGVQNVANTGGLYSVKFQVYVVKPLKLYRGLPEYLLSSFTKASKPATRFATKGLDGFLWKLTRPVLSLPLDLTPLTTNCSARSR